MSKNHRLTRADLSAGRTSKRLHGTLFSLSVSPLSGSRSSSFTCVVSKKVAAKAVHRNLIERRCREAARARLRGFSSPSPLALVFRAGRNAVGASFAAVKQDVDVLFDKISNPRYNLPQ